MKFAIVVLNYMNYRLTIECVDNLISLYSKDVLVIIVDNNSSNDSYDILSKTYGNYKNIEVIESGKNGGYAFGNNIGFKYLSENYPSIQYYCVSNPDAKLISNKTLHRLADIIDKDNNIGVISSVMLLNNNFEPQNLGYFKFPTSKDIYWQHLLVNRSKQDLTNYNIAVNDEYAYVDFVCGSFFMVRKEALLKCHFLDEGTFLYNEECILALKMKENGYREALLINDYYTHNHVFKKGTDISLSQKLKQEKIGFNSRSYLCKKYYSGKYYNRLILAHYINCIHLTLAFIFHKMR